MSVIHPSAFDIIISDSHSCIFHENLFSFCEVPPMAAIRGAAGSPIVSFKYKDGVIVATDLGASYGGLALSGFKRIFKLTENCIVAFSGKVSDIQYLYRELSSMIESDPQPLTPEGIHRWIQHILYYKRTCLEILQVSAVVCGLQTEGQSGSEFECVDKEGRLLGAANSKGSFWFDDSVATGLASSLILPILRDHETTSMDKNEALKLMEDSMRVLQYKGCQITGRIQIGLIDKSGIEIKEPYVMKTDWTLGIKTGDVVL